MRTSRPNARPLRLVRRVGSLLAVLASLSAAGALADEAVVVGGAKAVLLQPAAAPRASVILMPGGDGRIDVSEDGQIGALRGNQLVRTRQAYADRGLAVLVLGSDGDLAAAIAFMAAIRRPVTVVATSRGTQRAAEGIASGARPDALVLTSGMLSEESGARRNVRSILGAPAKLPPTLVIHHRGDSCRVTAPAGVEPFVRWAGGRAKVAWLEGGIDQGDPCEARSFHGFNGLDAAVVDLVAALGP